MLTLFILAIALGILAGIITGLTPGLHVNLISILAVSFAATTEYPPAAIAIFIIALSITHTFLDSIPSIFLGAPDPTYVLGVLPGHQLLLDGQGYQAVKLTVIGSLLALIVTIILVPIAIPILPGFYKHIQPFIGWLLLAAVIFTVIIKESTWQKRVWASSIFLFSGVLGLLVLKIPMDQPLLPMLSGIFGISGLLLSLNTKNIIPKQDITKPLDLKTRQTVPAVIAAIFSGSLTGIFPGLGSASAALISMSVLKNIQTKATLILLGGINTVNFAFSLGTLYALERARNGAVVAIMQITELNPALFIAMLAAALIAGAIAAVLALQIGKGAVRLVTWLPYKALVLAIIAFIAALTFYFCNWIGIVILVISTALGCIAPLVSVKRSNAMGCLLIPVLIFFFT